MKDELEVILEKCPCAQCDGSGSYATPVLDGDGGVEAEETQCQFCFELRRPFMEEAVSQILKLIEGKVDELLIHEFPEIQECEGREYIDKAILKQKLGVGK